MSGNVLVTTAIVIVERPQLSRGGHIPSLLLCSNGLRNL